MASVLELVAAFRTPGLHRSPDFTRTAQRVVELCFDGADALMLRPRLPRELERALYDFLAPTGPFLREVYEFSLASSSRHLLSLDDISSLYSALLSADASNLPLLYQLRLNRSRATSEGLVSLDLLEWCLVRICAAGANARVTSRSTNVYQLVRPTRYCRLMELYLRFLHVRDRENVWFFDLPSSARSEANQASFQGAGAGPRWSGAGPRLSSSPYGAGGLPRSVGELFVHIACDCWFARNVQIGAAEQMLIPLDVVMAYSSEQLEALEEQEARVGRDARDPRDLRDSFGPFERSVQGGRGTDAAGAYPAAYPQSAPRPPATSQRMQRQRKDLTYYRTEVLQVSQRVSVEAPCFLTNIIDLALLFARYVCSPAVVLTDNCLRTSLYVGDAALQARRSQGPGAPRSQARDGLRLPRQVTEIPFCQLTPLFVHEPVSPEAFSRCRGHGAPDPGSPPSQEDIYGPQLDCGSRQALASFLRRSSPEYFETVERHVLPCFYGFLKCTLQSEPFASKVFLYLLLTRVYSEALNTDPRVITGSRLSGDIIAAGGLQGHGQGQPGLTPLSAQARPAPEKRVSVFDAALSRQAPCGPGRDEWQPAEDQAPEALAGAVAIRAVFYFPLLVEYLRYSGSRMMGMVVDALKVRMEVGTGVQPVHGGLTSLVNVSSALGENYSQALLYLSAVAVLFARMSRPFVKNILGVLGEQASYYLPGFYPRDPALSHTALSRAMALYNLCEPAMLERRVVQYSRPRSVYAPPQAGRAAEPRLYKPQPLIEPAYYSEIQPRTRNEAEKDLDVVFREGGSGAQGTRGAREWDGYATGGRYDPQEREVWRSGPQPIRGAPAPLIPLRSGYAGLAAHALAFLSSRGDPRSAGVPARKPADEYSREAEALCKSVQEKVAHMADAYKRALAILRPDASSTLRPARYLCTRWLLQPEKWLLAVAGISPEHHETRVAVALGAPEMLPVARISAASLYQGLARYTGDIEGSTRPPGHQGASAPQRSGASEADRRAALGLDGFLPRPCDAVLGEDMVRLRSVEANGSLKDRLGFRLMSRVREIRAGDDSDIWDSRVQGTGVRESLIRTSALPFVYPGPRPNEIAPLVYVLAVLSIVLSKLGSVVFYLLHLIFSAAKPQWAPAFEGECRVNLRVLARKSFWMGVLVIAAAVWLVLWALQSFVTGR